MYLSPRHFEALGSTMTRCKWFLVLWCTGRPIRRHRPALAVDSTCLDGGERGLEGCVRVCE